MQSIETTDLALLKKGVLDEMFEDSGTDCPDLTGCLETAVALMIDGYITPPITALQMRTR